MSMIELDIQKERRKVRIKPTSACILIPGAFIVILAGLLLAQPWLAPLRTVPPSRLILLFVPISLGLFLVYRQDNRRQKNLIEQGEQVTGTVREVIRGNRLYKLRVEYRYDGCVYNEVTGNLLNVFSHPFSVNQQLTLFIDPRNPQSFAVYEASAYTLVQA